MSQDASTRFCVIVPVKPTAYAKSRLAPLGDAARRALVEAFARDTVAAALACPRVGAVLVVTDDHVLARSLTAAGAHVVPDGVVEDLNGSLAQAAAEGRRRWPDLVPAVLCADLPALRTEQLTRALEAATLHGASFVPDADGRGTTMFTALAPDVWEPRFGLGSRDAHLAAGAHELAEIDVPTLRRDVDTPEDLRDAVRLGVGDNTAAVVSGLRL